MAQCIRRDGLHKKSWEKRGEARQAARHFPSHLGKVEPYRCRDCGQYHIGHKREG